jgi:hypothetical protein
VYNGASGKTEFIGVMVFCLKIRNYKFLKKKTADCLYPRIKLYEETDDESWSSRTLDCNINTQYDGSIIIMIPVKKISNLQEVGSRR